jgi:hypothetical protein
LATPALFLMLLKPNLSIVNLKIIFCIFSSLF